MPPRATRSTRRGATAGAAAKGGKQQQHISFGKARVTKPGARNVSGSDKKAEQKIAAIERAEVSASESVPVSDVEIDEKATATAEEEATKVSGIEGLGGREAELAATSELAIRQQVQEAGAEAPSAEETAAAGVPERQIKQYWARKEAERTTRRVHQEGMSLHEKVLREFDMSSQFGNCIGIPRSRRWKLAHELGLQPPIEVLAVLMREDRDRNDPRVQRAYADELMTSRFVVT